MDHPIFAQFEFQQEFSDDQYHHSICGVRTLRNYEKHIIGDVVAGGRVDVVSDVKGLPYRRSDDYYEWIDLLTAIHQAGEGFILLELGAGFGRWMANAAHALGRHRSKASPRARFLGVEADHRHFSWMQEHLALNQVTGDDTVILNKAVSGTRSFELFPMLDVHATFGARLIQVDGANLPEMYEAGTRFVQGGDTVFQIVEVITLEDCIHAALPDGNRPIDIIHMDIQGAELKAVESSIGILNDTVKRMHIGTHGTEIENSLYDILIANDWRVERFFRVGSEVYGEFGKFTTYDGMLSVSNTRLAGAGLQG